MEKIKVVSTYSKEVRLSGVYSPDEFRKLLDETVASLWKKHPDAVAMQESVFFGSNYSGDVDFQYSATYERDETDSEYNKRMDKLQKAALKKEANAEAVAKAAKDKKERDDAKAYQHYLALRKRFEGVDVDD